MAVPIEFHLDHLQISEETRQKIIDRINDLEQGHQDLTNAFVSVKQLSGKPTVNEYEATIVLYHRPNNITGTEKSGVIPHALLGALSSVKRQLRRARSATPDRRKRAQKPAIAHKLLQSD